MGEDHASHHLGMYRCKPVAKQGKRQTPLNYSKRRISTGSSRAAARAGTTVARRDIPIATTEIHTPSASFGWNGTNLRIERNETVVAGHPGEDIPDEQT